jgi:hypothetical protein
MWEAWRERSDRNAFHIAARDRSRGSRSMGLGRVHLLSLSEPPRPVGLAFGGEHLSVMPEVRQHALNGQELRHTALST